MFLAASSCVAQQPAPTAPPAALPFHYVIDPSLVTEPQTYRESDGVLHTVALVKDDKGVTSEFVEDEVVVVNDPAEVKTLVSKYGARLVRQITVNVISAEGKPLPPAPTTPRTLLQIDASSSPLHLEEEAPRIKAVGTHAFSSARGANLAAIVASERAAGHPVRLNFLTRGMQFPTSSKEQPDLNGVSDAYLWPEFDHAAWQYVQDAGIKTHPLVAIIDGGFWLNSQGVPCGYAVDALCQSTLPTVGSSDLPRNFQQADATGGSGLAGGQNPNSCSQGSACPWHGNRSASVALGIVNNKTGAAGMGGLVAEPFLIKVSGPVSETTAAIETAVAQGASIISISSGGACNYWCAQETITGDDQDAPIKAFNQGVLVVASAGNGDSSKPPKGLDAGSIGMWPCISSLCVGAMNSFPDGNGYFTKVNGVSTGYSNFGVYVELWAPTSIHAMPDQSSSGSLPAHTGTSASAPYVAGVAALMKAVNPSLTAKQMLMILTNTGTPIVTSASPDDKPQWGTLIAPLEAVVMANHGAEVKPKVVITAPKNGATVGEQLYQGVTFSASAVDVLAGSPPASVAGTPLNRQHTYCAQSESQAGAPPITITCLPTPFYSASGSLNWPFPTTGLSLTYAAMGIANNPQLGFNWPLPVLSYTAGPVTWTSSVDGPMIGQGYSENGGTSFSYVFSPTAPPGRRTITATFKNSQGLASSSKIEVDYAPKIDGPSPVIVYPPLGATFQAGTIPVRGYSNTGVNLDYLPCSELKWQQGIDATPISSTDYAGATGVCEAKVPFKSGSRTLRLTAKGPTGASNKADENLTITAVSHQTTVFIDDPIRGQQFPRFLGGSAIIGLHAFVQDAPASGGLTYTWSWYPAGSGNKITIGTGEPRTWTTNSACGTITIEVVVTGPSLPTNSSPKATTQIDVVCSSSG
jgi:Subtilase family